MRGTRIVNVAVSDDDVRITPGWDDMRVSFASAGDTADAVDRAVAILRREGVVVLDDLLDPALLEACRQETVARYPDYDKPDAERYLGSFPRRHTVPVVIDDRLADPAIFAQPVIRAIDLAMLGPDNILESLGLLVSIPGGPNQGRHHDGLLFEENNLDRLLPTVALSISIPLVALDEKSGTTAFWRRSHREPMRDGPPDFAPALPVGSALVWDFRTHHSGRGNQGDAPRPIIFSVHSRDWWQEPKSVRATQYRKLQVARTVHDGMDKAMRTFTIRADIVDRVAP